MFLIAKSAVDVGDTHSIAASLAPLDKSRVNIFGLSVEGKPPSETLRLICKGLSALGKAAAGATSESGLVSMAIRDGCTIDDVPLVKIGDRTDALSKKSSPQNNANWLRATITNVFLVT